MLMSLLLNGSNLVKLRSRFAVNSARILAGLPTPHLGLQTGEASRKRLLSFSQAKPFAVHLLWHWVMPTRIAAV
jgi:hypothetical protein